MDVVKHKLFYQFRNMPEGLKSSVAYTACSIIQRGLSFLTLPLFARLLTPEQYGQATIYAAWSTFLEVVVSLYLPYGTFSKAMIKFAKDRDGYIASVDSICLLFGSIFLIVYYPLRVQLNRLFQLPTAIIFFMVLDIVANTATRCWMAKERFDYKYKFVLIVTLVISLLSPVVSLFAVISFDEKGYARIIGSAFVGIIVGIFFWLRNLSWGKHLYRRKFWRYALAFNIPLIPYYFGQMIYNQSDRIMISHLVGTDKAGIYGIAHSLAMALGIVLTSINNSYVPWIYRQMKEEKWRRINEISSWIAVLMSVLLMLVILLTPEIVLIMAGEAYREAMWCVPPIAMSLLMLLYAQFFINIEFYFEKKWYLIIGMISSGIVNIILNYYWIPCFGFVAAAYTTLLSFVMNAVINYYFYKKILKDKLIEDVMYNYRLLLLIAGVSISLGLGAIAIYEYLLIRMILIVLIVIFLLTFQSIIQNQLRNLVGR